MNMHMNGHIIVPNVINKYNGSSSEELHTYWPESLFFSSTTRWYHCVEVDVTNVKTFASYSGCEDKR